ncbi:MAG: hypothetical protein ACI9T7_002524 [Oleiphilaceae bacterium]|jgi:hypothetical protein
MRERSNKYCGAIGEFFGGNHGLAVSRCRRSNGFLIV